MNETLFLYLSVANGNFKRYILASENMKAGDLIKTHNEIPKNPVQVGMMGISYRFHDQFAAICK